MARGRGAPREPALDDAAFLRALVGRLQGTAEPQPVFLAGISNGAGFAEHVGRHGLLPLAGLFLVAGLILRRRAARNRDLPSQRRVVAVETVARDWAAANGISGEPASVRLADEAGDPPVTRLTWSAPGAPPVVLYRVEGGGHGWPGGPQYLPARVIGPIPRHLDASGLLLAEAGS